MLFAATLFLSGLLLYGQSGKHSLHRATSKGKNAPEFYIPTDTITVDMNLQRPPVFALEGGKKTRIGTGIPDAARLWLVNEISFCFFYQSTKRSSFRTLKNLKVELYLYAPGETRDNMSFRWFCGVQALDCLVVEPGQKMRRYWASLFLPSAYVYLHMPLDHGRYSLRALEGVVFIADQDNTILGRRAFGYKSKLAPARAQRLIAAAMELRGKKTRNQILLWPREKTPWAWVDADRFELPFTLFDEAKGENKASSAPPQIPAEENGKENEE